MKLDTVKQTHKELIENALYEMKIIDKDKLDNVMEGMEKLFKKENVHGDEVTWIFLYWLICTTDPDDFKEIKDVLRDFSLIDPGKLNSIMKNS